MMRKLVVVWAVSLFIFNAYAENASFNVATKIVNIPVVEINGAVALKDVRFHFRDDNLFELVDYKQYTPQAPVNTGSKGKWVVLTDEKNPVDDTRKVTIALSSDSGQSRFKGNYLLLARCLSGETEFYISWGTFIAGRPQYVTTRIDTDSPVTSGWPLSTSNDITFYPGDAKAFLKSMFNKSKLVAQTASYSEGTMTGTWDITGLENVIPPLREACGW